MYAQFHPLVVSNVNIHSIFREDVTLDLENVHFYSDEKKGSCLKAKKVEVNALNGKECFGVADCGKMEILENVNFSFEDIHAKSKLFYLVAEVVFVFEKVFRSKQKKEVVVLNSTAPLKFVFFSIKVWIEFPLDLNNYVMCGNNVTFSLAGTEGSLSLCSGCLKEKSSGVEMLIVRNIDESELNFSIEWRENCFKFHLCDFSFEHEEGVLFFDGVLKEILSYSKFLSSFFDEPTMSSNEKPLQIRLYNSY